MRPLRQYREEYGLLWPAHDPRVARAISKTVHDIDIVTPHVSGRDVVVQAGGNCGAWPIKLAGMFGAVYTWEPDHLNFGALAINTLGHDNIIKFQAALGSGPGFVDLARLGSNTGAHWIEGHGLYPVMTIDSLDLQACDLIYLDIEGAEFDALRGAAKTIERHRPVIGYEDKGLSERFGHAVGDIDAWLSSEYGYKNVGRVRKDTLMVPA